MCPFIARMALSQTAKMADGLASTFKTMGNVAESDIVYTSKHLMKHLLSPLLPTVGLSPATKEAVRVLDTACGTGVFMQELQGEDGLPKDVISKSSFLAPDNAQGMVDLVRKRIADEGWVNAEARVLDAQVRDELS